MSVSTGTCDAPDRMGWAGVTSLGKTRSQGLNPRPQLDPSAQALA